MSKEVLLYSGGPDAHIAWEFLGRPEALYIQHNCRYEMKQIFAIRRIIEKTKTKNIKISPTVLDLSLFEEMDANLPLRNMYLCMYAANMEYDLIHIVLQKGEQSIPDRTPEFCHSMSLQLSILTGRLTKVESVFLDMTKQDMVKWYVENGRDVETLKETVSCFNSSERNCGECPACFRRWVAFEYNGIHEQYSKDLKNWSGTQDYIKKMRAGKYDMERSQQTLEVLRKFNLVK